MNSTFWFFGVSTAESAMQRIYPLWMTELGIGSRLVGVDFPLDAPAAEYRAAVERVIATPGSIGGLITTHKLNVLAAAGDLFADLDDSARLLHEVSCLAMRDGALHGAALDDRTSRLALEALIPDGHWDRGGELLLLGAGGASIATTLGLHRAAAEGRPVPTRIHVTARSAQRLDEMRALHERIGFTIPVTTHVTADAHEADAVVAALPPASVLVNATGMGKDRPGSPLTDDVVYPTGSIVWDMNYRGPRHFLVQAEARRQERDLAVEDGWDYFVYSWTSVVAAVHGIDIPARGELFDRLSRIARSTMA
ncbi:shikimate dehydrogenase [Microbacterium luteolum]|uniref:Shikimate dehydrogenase n=1 Tax=Microbacterium luteolum TaxID=69367 RepID=A0ABY7XN30_MICLT|nr:shikimate dehydrogenase [Microbacterium luteolum]WDM42215.1 shikimate dehydrogenase [Microbacterium luteolum]